MTQKPLIIFTHGGGRLANQHYRITLLGGFFICCWPLVKKHQDKIKDYLQFKQEHFDKASQFIQELRKKHDYLIGVSIRQTDYNTKSAL